MWLLWETYFSSYVKCTFTFICKNLILTNIHETDGSCETFAFL